MKKRTIILSIIGLLAILYAGGVVLFLHRFMPNTFINSYVQQYDVGFKGKKTIEDIIQENDNCPFTVSWPNSGEYSFTLKEIKDDNTHIVNVDELLQGQDAFAWPIEIFKSKYLVYDDGFDVNENKLIKLITSWGLKDGVSPHNAYIAINENGEFYIEKETKGSVIDTDKLKLFITQHLNSNDRNIVIDGDIYKTAEITSTDPALNKQLAQLEDMVNRVITLDMVGQSEKVIVGNLIDKEALLADGSIVFNEEKIGNYLSYLESTYNTYNTKRKFVTHNGYEIMVGAEYDTADDNYGFILDAEATKEAILSALSDDSVEKIDAVWSMQGNTHDANGDIGNTYIEISLSEQHLWYFVNGQLFVDTPVVTGLPTEARHTPKGLFQIYNKAEDITLRGSMDGESWNSDVNYWLSVTYTEVGIHDAPWRGTSPSYYGGNIYQYDGSHGCINVPYDAAKTLYENVEYGTCVVIY